MQRREFLAASAAAALGITLAKGGRAADGGGNRQLIELRIYSFTNPDKQRAYEQFFAEAAIPALNRAGVEPVGAWKMLPADNPALSKTGYPNNLYILFPHKHAESVLTLESRLAADEAYQRSGEKVL